MTQTELLPALQFTPPVLSLDFEVLEARIDNIIEQYSGLIVTEEDVPAIKSEMAGLNKLAKQFGDARKEAVARVSDPIKEFEGKIKTLEKKVVEVRGTLDEQIKAHIERERESRRFKVQVTVDCLKDDHGVPGLYIPIQDNWLNKTITEKQIAAEISTIILQHKKEQADLAALEQAKKDRATVIENHNAAVAQARGFAMPVSTFYSLLSLDISLAEAMRLIDEDYDIEEATRKKAAQSAPEPAPTPTPKAEKAPEHFMDFPEQPAPTAILMKRMSITATYKAENAPRITSLYSKLRDVCETINATVVEL